MRSPPHHEVGLMDSFHRCHTGGIPIDVLLQDPPTTTCSIKLLNPGQPIPRISGRVSEVRNNRCLNTLLFSKIEFFTILEYSKLDILEYSCAHTEPSSVPYPVLHLEQSFGGLFVWFQPESTKA